MSRDELLTMLANLEAEGKISREEAVAVLRAFDAGELGAEDLPLPPSQARILADAAAAQAAMQNLTSTLNVTANRIRVVPIDTRRRFVVRILDDLGERSFQATRAFKTGELSVRDWHQRMKTVVRDDLLQQATLGKGRPLTPAELDALQETLDSQAGYLKRFAEEVSAREAIGNPMSERQIAERARMYQGEGYSEFWRQAEAGAPEGTVFRYIARDDDATCGNCVEAEQGSPYLAGEGPMPGAVCLGRGKCRCRREPYVDEEAYARLTGGEVPA